jgi:hypothetical protein
MKTRKHFFLFVAAVFVVARAAAETLPIPANCTDTTRGRGVVRQFVTGGFIEGTFSVNASSRRGHLRGRFTYTDAQTGVRVVARKLTRYEADVFNPGYCRYMEFQGRTSTRQPAFVSAFVCDEASLGTADALSVYVDPQPHNINTEIFMNGNLSSGDIAVRQTCR